METQEKPEKKEEPITDPDVGTTEKPTAEDPKSPRQSKQQFEPKERYPSFVSPNRQETSLSPPKDTSTTKITKEEQVLEQLKREESTERHRKRSNTPYREREESLSPTSRVPTASKRKILQTPQDSQEEVQPTEHWSRWSRFQYEKRQQSQSHTDTMAEGSRRSSRRSLSSIRRMSTDTSPLPSGSGSQQVRDISELVRRLGFHRPKKSYGSSPSHNVEIESKNEQMKRLQKWKQELEEIERRLHRESIPQKRSSRKLSLGTTSVEEKTSSVRGHSAPPESSGYRPVFQTSPEKKKGERKHSGKSRTPTPSSHKSKSKGRGRHDPLAYHRDPEVEEYYLRQLEKLGHNIAKLMRIILDLNPQFSAEYIYNVASSRDFDTGVELVEFVMNSLPEDANLGTYSKRNLPPSDD